jgi:cytochrome bd-type quinol oxidase subunit 1
MNSWIVAALVTAGILIVGAVAALALYNWRDNRWIASGAFLVTAACLIAAAPAFFIIGAIGGWK